MCYVYASADPGRYASTTRSVRLQGYVTSVRLENEFWEILEMLAADQGESIAGFIGELYGEVLEERGAVRNLSSMLRVACAIHLQRRATESGAAVECPSEHDAGHPAHHRAGQREAVSVTAPGR